MEEQLMLYYLTEEISYSRNDLSMAVILRQAPLHQESCKVCSCQPFGVH